MLPQTEKVTKTDLKAPKDNPLARLMQISHNGLFAKSKDMPVVGQWRQRAWQVTTALEGSDAELALWDGRAIEYWALQGYKYGVLYELEHTSNYLVGNTFVSRARVMGVLKGTRIEERAWRAANPPGKVAAQLGIA